MSREPLCRYLDMRRAGTMGALSCCAGSQASGVSQALWYVLGRVATQLESSFEAVESFDMGPAAEATPG